MSNIYDIFNERKKAVSMISEGFDYSSFDESSVEPFDTIEEGIDVLTNIQREMQNTTIKVCAESLVADMLLENAIYEEFDTEHIEEMIEESVKEKVSNVGKRIQELWGKIKAWFSNLFSTIANHFMNGEKLAKKYPDLKSKLKADTGKVKCYDIASAATAMAQCDGLSAGIKFDNAYLTGSDYKTELFGKLKVSDKKGLKEKVMSFFVKGGKFEKKEMQINSLPTDIVFNYAVSKKDIIDSLKNQQKLVDSDFTNAMRIAKDNKVGAEKDAKKYINEVISVLNFMVNLKTDIIKTEIAVVKKLSSMCLSICRHAVGAKSDSDDNGGGEEKPAKKEEKEETAKESFDYLLNSLDEEIEFEDNEWDL